MSLSLSGYLPSDEGLSDLADDLVDKFEGALNESDDTPVQVVVVGILNVESVKYRRDPEKPPVVEVRFAHLEPAAGATAEQLRLVLAGLRSHRNGEQSLSGVDEALQATVVPIDRAKGRG